MQQSGTIPGLINHEKRNYLGWRRAPLRPSAGFQCYGSRKEYGVLNRRNPTTISKEAAMIARNVLDENKRLVTEFYELAINQQKPAEAARKYIEFPYRQHNPEVVDGPDGFVQFISAMQEKHPKLKVVVSKVLADDDLVALHVHLTREASDPGLAIAELFRLKNGKIIEHWDVVQPVPAKTASGNSMF
jgi:predicted SnoaL-like aldol condensation-catalyzing enzyme